MKVTKEKLIEFLDKKVLSHAENHPQATETIKRKTRTTRMRLNNLKSPEKVEEFFWNAMASDNGIDSYTKIKGIGAKTFEDVRIEFKILCGRK
jgi:predicted flap endonuclease-1-like 5' DNA nuclease